MLRRGRGWEGWKRRGSDSAGEQIENVLVAYEIDNEAVPPGEV